MCVSDFLNIQYSNKNNNLNNLRRLLEIFS